MGDLRVNFSAQPVPLSCNLEKEPRSRTVVEAWGRWAGWARVVEGDDGLQGSQAGLSVAVWRAGAGGGAEGSCQVVVVEGHMGKSASPGHMAGALPGTRSLGWLRNEVRDCPAGCAGGGGAREVQRVSVDGGGCWGFRYRGFWGVQAGDDWARKGV